MTPIFRHLVLAAAATAAIPASAQSFENIEALEQRVAAALGAGIGEPGGPARPIDRRLRLAACPGPVSVEAPTLGAATVRCEQLGWRIRVPVTRDDSGQSDGGSNPAPSPVAARGNRAAPVVRRGDPVALVVISGSFTVSRQAVADQDGAPGDRIRVRTEPRAAPIIGQVLADGRILMNGFN